MITSCGRIVIVFIFLSLLLTLLPVWAGMGAAGFLGDDVPDEDDLSVINDIPFTWLRIDMNDLSILLTVGLSIFILFVVYLGGRSKHRRFNDRTIAANAFSDHVSLLLRTAQRGAVFNFLNDLPAILNNTQQLTKGGTNNDAYDC